MRGRLWRNAFAIATPLRVTDSRSEWSDWSDWRAGALNLVLRFDLLHVERVIGAIAPRQNGSRNVTAVTVYNPYYTLTFWWKYEIEV